MEDYHQILNHWNKLKRFKNLQMFQIQVYFVIFYGLIHKNKNKAGETIKEVYHMYLVPKS
jgi:hypothetical protein